MRNRQTEAMRIVQISDTHLSHRAGIGNRNFEELAAFINDQLRPDLVVHTGDVSILDLIRVPTARPPASCLD